MSRDYELTLIVDSQLGDEGVGQTVEKYKTYLSEHGVLKMGVDRRGVRKLAYQIKKHNQADFTFLQFEGEPGLVAEMDRQLRLDQAVLRHLFVRLEEISIPEETEAEAESEEVADEGEKPSEETKE